MKLAIESFDTIGSGKALVSFGCPIGTGRALWKSKSRRPVVGSFYDVELAISVPIQIGLNGIFVDERACAVAVDEKGVYLKCLFESLEEDGIAYLRLTSDCLVMAESDFRAQDLGRMILISLEFQELEVWAQGDLKTPYETH